MLVSLTVDGPEKVFPKLNKALAVEWSLKDEGFRQNYYANGPDGRTLGESQDENRRIELDATRILQPQLNRRRRLPLIAKMKTVVRPHRT